MSEQGGFCNLCEHVSVRCVARAHLALRWCAALSSMYALRIEGMYAQCDGWKIRVVGGGIRRVWREVRGRACVRLVGCLVCGGWSLRQLV